MLRKFSRGLLKLDPYTKKIEVFNPFVTTFLFKTVENKKDKITPTLHATPISCYCQETHKYKQ